jgi:GT2 family glycosyltransferase
VIVCDDGSDPGLLEANKTVIHRLASSIPGLEMLMNNDRLGIAKSWNRLSRHYSDAEIISLLNDDVEVVADWLDVLRFSIRKNLHIGMLGLNSYPCAVKRDWVLADRMPPRIDYREAKLLSGGGKLLASLGSAFAFRKNVFDEVGGFDERYFCFYEELDFGVMLREKGYFHYMADYPIVYHMGGATMSGPKMDAHGHMLRSRVSFFEKWGKTPEEIRRDYGPAPACVEWNTQLKTWRE